MQINNLEHLERALSIRQPYVEQILLGEKTAEYRSRTTNCRGRVYLYAAKKFADLSLPGADASKAELSLPRGLIVGSVDIVECFYAATDGCYVWKLAAPVRYDTPIRPQGTPQPGFWRPKF